MSDELLEKLDRLESMVIILVERQTIGAEVRPERQFETVGAFHLAPPIEENGSRRIACLARTIGSWYGDCDQNVTTVARVTPTCLQCERMTEWPQLGGQSTFTCNCNATEV
jgi:hypothetical protein